MWIAAHGASVALPHLRSVMTARNDLWFAILERGLEGVVPEAPPEPIPYSWQFDAMLQGLVILAITTEGGVEPRRDRGGDARSRAGARAPWTALRHNPLAIDTRRFRVMGFGTARSGTMQASSARRPAASLILTALVAVLVAVPGAASRDGARAEPRRRKGDQVDDDRRALESPGATWAAGAADRGRAPIRTPAGATSVRVGQLRAAHRCVVPHPRCRTSLLDRARRIFVRTRHTAGRCRRGCRQRRQRQ